MFRFSRYLKPRRDQLQQAHEDGLVCDLCGCYNYIAACCAEDHISCYRCLMAYFRSSSRPEQMPPETHPNVFYCPLCKSDIGDGAEELCGALVEFRSIVASSRFNPDSFVLFNCSCCNSCEEFTYQEAPEHANGSGLCEEGERAFLHHLNARFNMVATARPNWLERDMLLQPWPTRIITPHEYFHAEDGLVLPKELHIGFNMLTGQAPLSSKILGYIERMDAGHARTLLEHLFGGKSKQ